MIIDILLDYRDNLKDWNKLEWYEKMHTERPQLDLDYIEDEAKTFNFEYLQDIKGLYDFELKKRIEKYLNENGYNTELANIVYE